MITHSDFQEVHEHSAGGVIALDVNRAIVYANPKAIGLIFGNRNFIGKRFDEFLCVSHAESFSAVLIDREFKVNAATRQLHVLISSTLFTDAEGDERTYLFIRDITPLKKKEDLLEYLNKASEAMAISRDTKTALSQLSQLIVPRFANWFSIDLLVDGELKELILAHEDPAMINWARRYRLAYPTDLNGETGTAKVLKTGEPNYIPFITEEMIAASIRNPEQYETISRMNLQSSITVSMGQNKRTTGVISFISTAAGRHFDKEDLRFAQSLASHIAFALENAHLNEAATAEINQRKLIESELKATQRRLRSALLSGMVGTWIRDLKTNIFYADESLAEMFGITYKADGYDPDIFHERIVTRNESASSLNGSAAVSSDGVYQTEYEVNTYHGPRWFSVRGKTEYSDQDEPGFFTGVMIDITERKQAELALQKNEELFRFLADAIPHKLWTSSPDGSATYYNKGWFDYTGLATFEEVKEKIWDVLHPDDRAIAMVEYPEGIRLGKAMQMEQRFRRQDGEYRWHLTRTSPHKDYQGNIILWVGTSTDIHEQKENEQRKDEFLSIASHELKTPLTSIKAFNQLMKRAKTEPPLNNFIDKSGAHIYRLEKLISDLLDVTKINAGKVAYNEEDFSIRKLLEDSIENVKYNTSHQIILERAPDIIFTGDPYRLEQVMNNLLSNAIKYSPRANQVIVNSWLEQDGITVSVQDFGIGIARENLNRLFDRYYRVDNTGMRFEGLGLGLFISSEILKRHKGSLWIESEQGKGSTFYFRLPLAQNEKSVKVVRTETYYQNDHIIIRYDENTRIMETDWIGFQDVESVKSGCLLMLEYLELHHADRIVNDNTHVQGNWSDAVEWVGNVWFPMMEKAGLKYFAHIFSPSTFSQLSAQKSIDIMAGIITTQYFTDAKLAKEWLNKKSY